MESIARGWVSLRGATRYAGLGPSTVSRAVHSGELPAYRVGGEFRIAIKDIDAWMRSFPRVGEETGCLSS